MDHRMCLMLALITLTLVVPAQLYAFTPGIDGPVTYQESLEGGSTVLKCDSSTHTPEDELMLLVWYKGDAPIYSYDARIHSEWTSSSFNVSGRVHHQNSSQPTELKVERLTEADQGLYHCRVDFLITPTRNIGVNLSVIVLSGQPFFKDEVGNSVKDKIGPFHEGHTLVLSCFVVGGKPPPRISWYSGETLVDASDGTPSDISSQVKENVLYLTLTRENTAPLSCRASNTDLAPPVVSTLQFDLYLSVEDVTISWLEGMSSEHTLQAGQRAIVRCNARGSNPQPDLSWWLGLKHLTPQSNQSWIAENRRAESVLEFTPTVNDNGGTLSCIATNSALAPNQGSKADLISLNVTYSPIIEVVKLGDEKTTDVAELDALQLECETKANPPVKNIVWYFNDTKITPTGIWEAVNITSNYLLILETHRHHTGQYSCAATNSVGETLAHHIAVTVLYPPGCAAHELTLERETVNCHVDAFPSPDTYFWHVYINDGEVQQLTTGTAILPLSQLRGSLSGILHVSCEASNGIAFQDKPCEKMLSLAHLRPPQPKQCDLAYEDNVFKIRCIPVENATYYEVSVWKMSSSNTSLILEQQKMIGGLATAMARSAELSDKVLTGWLVRGEVGCLRSGDEAGAAACNRYGCSRALLLRPTETLLKAAAPPWWNVFLEKDVGISVGAVVLLASFIISTLLVRRMLRKPKRGKPPVIQVLQLDEVARDYLENIERKHHASCSARSCSSGYSGGSMDSEPPLVDRQRKPPIYFWDPGPPPDVTLTLSRESAV